MSITINADFIISIMEGSSVVPAEARPLSGGQIDYEALALDSIPSRKSFVVLLFPGHAFAENVSILVGFNSADNNLKSPEKNVCGAFGFPVSHNAPYSLVGLLWRYPRLSCLLRPALPR